MIGQVIDQYKIVKPIARNAITESFLAVHVETNVRHILKAVNRKLLGVKGFKDQLLDDSGRIIQLDHPNVIPLANVLDVDGGIYTVHEFVKGKSLDKILRDSETYPYDGLANVAMGCLAAVQYCAAQGYVHQFLQPKKVIVTPEQTARLLDFGKTLQVAKEKYRKKDKLIKPAHYFPPERFDKPGLGDVRMSIYSVGMMMYEMATGRLPVSGSTYAELAHLHAQGGFAHIREVNPQVQKGVADFIMRSLAARPEDRYQSIEEAMRVLHTSINQPEGNEPLTIEEFGGIGAGERSEDSYNFGPQLAAPDDGPEVVSHHEWKDGEAFENQSDGVALAGGAIEDNFIHEEKTPDMTPVAGAADNPDLIAAHDFESSVDANQSPGIDFAVDPAASAGGDDFNFGASAPAGGDFDFGSGGGDFNFGDQPAEGNAHSFDSSPALKDGGDFGAPAGEGFDFGDQSQALGLGDFGDTPGGSPEEQLGLGGDFPAANDQSPAEQLGLGGGLDDLGGSPEDQLGLGGGAADGDLGGFDFGAPSQDAGGGSAGGGFDFGAPDSDSGFDQPGASSAGGDDFNFGGNNTLGEDFAMDPSTSGSAGDFGDDFNFGAPEPAAGATGGAGDFNFADDTVGGGGDGGFDLGGSGGDGGFDLGGGSGGDGGFDLGDGPGGTVEPGFSFGNEAPAGDPLGQASDGGFSFADDTAAGGDFNFADDPSSAGAAPAGGDDFNFGDSPAPAGGDSFNFGDSPAPAGGDSFNFGESPAQADAGFSFGEESPADDAGFSFGGDEATVADPGFSFGEEAPADAGGGFDFGGGQAQGGGDDFNFGDDTAAPAAGDGGFNFGDDPGASSAGDGFSFGDDPGASSAGGDFNFGDDPAPAPADDGGFNLGGDGGTDGFDFGKEAAEGDDPFNFGGEAAGGSGGDDFSAFDTPNNDMLMSETPPGEDAGEQGPSPFSTDSGSFTFEADDSPADQAKMSFDSEADMNLPLGAREGLKDSIDQLENEEDLAPVTNKKKGKKGKDKKPKKKVVRKFDKKILALTGVLAVLVAAGIFYVVTSSQQKSRDKAVEVEVQAMVDSGRFDDALSRLSAYIPEAGSSYQRRFRQLRATIEEDKKNLTKQVNTLMARAAEMEQEGRALTDGKNDALGQYMKILDMYADYPEALERANAIKTDTMNKADAALAESNSLMALELMAALHTADRRDRVVGKKYNELRNQLNTERSATLREEIDRDFSSQRYAVIVPKLLELDQIDPKSEYVAQMRSMLLEAFQAQAERETSRRRFNEAEQIFTLMLELDKDNTDVQQALSEMTEYKLNNAIQTKLVQLERAVSRKNFKRQQELAIELSNLDQGNQSAIAALNGVSEEINRLTNLAESERQRGQFTKTAELYKTIFDINGSEEARQSWMKYARWSPPPRMAYIPKGAFLYGSRSTRPSAPQRMVMMGSYFIDQYEVTNAQFKEFVDANPNWAPDRIDANLHDGRYLRHWVNGAPRQDDLNRPVTFVSWHAANAYARWRGKRLPTEAEWEKAARGNDSNTKTEPYWWGSFSDAKKAIYEFYPEKKPGPVGSFPANSYEVFEILGNVNEWVADSYDPQFYKKPEVANPFNDADGDNKVYRGGSFKSRGKELVVYLRNYGIKELCSAEVGFRCAMDAKDAPDD